ncbi:RNA polymerase sigma-70 subunit ECF subfamily [Candidatus Termititenax dinenymphae]|uniref:RNA polymerase sigma-70 subunit ECF subfamily n=1 Tax=Candidatus Termititenax dinenymphae TaxID=2218523 RepID=A0A388TJR3_9BACT|nr:RNA polymerase sigma-70 subunit ECF subfamily [Candidatus Termititenax dinenymphae]
MAKTETYLEEFIAGDQAAFQSLYADTSPMLYRVVLRMAGSREEAEDILHDVYIKVYEKRHSYRPELSDLRTWLYRIAVNHTLNQLKRRAWLGGNLAKVFNRSDKRSVRDIAEDYADAEEEQTALQLLQKVPENYRICLIMRDIEEKSYEETAKVLKLELGTVKSRINRGRQILKDMYGKETDNEKL